MAGRVALLWVVLGFLACGEGPLADPPPEERAVRSLGLVAVTLTAGDGPPGSARGSIAAAPAPVEEDGEHGIELRPLSTGSFTWGERDDGGERYLYATFAVRNASVDGAPYTSPRTDLTFLAVGTDGTLGSGSTPASRLKRFDGTAADASMAAELRPAGAIHVGPDGSRTVRFTDVVQAFSEAEVAAIAVPPAVRTVFPYGFMVRNVHDDGRTLPASPGPDDWDGAVTFAYRIPLRPDPADDPFEITLHFLAVEDDVTRVTQALEEQQPAVEMRDEAFEARASEIGATMATTLPGGYYHPATGERRLCSVRTAGESGAATATLFPAAGLLQSWTPSPGGTGLDTDGTISAAFDMAVTGVSPSSFAVHGDQSGRRFIGGSYTGEGTSAIATPAGDFFPGETVEASLTIGMTICEPQVARWRVASAPASSTLGSPAAFGVGIGGADVEFGDLNGDGLLDMVTTVLEAVNEVQVRLGTGDADLFGPAESYLTGVAEDIRSVRLGDLDGDGDLDVALAHIGSTVVVLPGNGDGTLGPPVAYEMQVQHPLELVDLNADGRLDVLTVNPIGSNIRARLGLGDGTLHDSQVHTTLPDNVGMRSIGIGDMNGDGIPDFVSPRAGGLQVLAGTGDGSFRRVHTHDLTSSAQAVAVGDVDGDGNLDVAASLLVDSRVVFLLGNGDGTLNEDVQRDYDLGVVSPEAVELADIDGDGNLDAVFGASSALLVMPGNGDGTFGAAIEAEGWGDATFDSGTLAVGDVNGDGRLDVGLVRGAEATVFLGQP